MKKSKFRIVLTGLFVCALVIGIGFNSSAQEVIECNWSLDECHRVTDASGHTYVYHGKKAETNPQIN